MRRFAIAGLLVAMAASPAVADEYNMVAAGCIPSMENYYESPGFSPFIRYSTTNDAIGFHPTNQPPGPLRFYCPIPRTLGTVSHLAILYTLAPGGHISADLYVMDKTDGAVSRIASVTAVSGTGIQDLSFTHTWDPSRFTYFVLIHLQTDNGVFPNSTQLNLVSLF